MANYETGMWDSLFEKVDASENYPLRELFGRLRALDESLRA